MGLYRPAVTHEQEVGPYPQHAAATATEERALFTAPVKCRIVAASIVADAAATGDNTNTTNLHLVNKGAAGVGATALADLNLPLGVNLVAFDEFAFTMLTTGLDLAEGDTVTLQFQKVGTGLNIGPIIVKLGYIPV